MVGRPSDFTEEIAAKIVERLSAGEPMASICRDDEMPGVTTVWEWQKARAAFSESIARAREVGFDQIASDCLLIADGKDKPSPEELLAAAETSIVTVRDHNRDRLRVDTRLKLLAKWDPKRYGEKLALGQADDLAPLTVIINKPA